MVRLTMSLMTDTPIAQGIEHRPPEAGAAVRIRLGVFFILFVETRDNRVRIQKGI